MGLVGEILFARMEALQGRPSWPPAIPLSAPKSCWTQVKTFAELSSAIVKEIEIKRDGEWGQRLLKERAADRQCDGQFHGPRAARSQRGAADAERPPARISPSPSTPEKREMALRYARLVAGSRNFAAAASFAAKQKTASEDLGAMLSAATMRIW